MFKKVLYFFVLLIALTAFISVNANASEDNIITIISKLLSYEQNYILISDEYEIYGNNKNLDEKDFYEISNSKYDKIYIHYSTNNYYDEYDMKITVNIQGNLNSLTYSYKEGNQLPTITNFKNFLRFYSNELLSYNNLISPASEYQGIFEDSVTSEIFVFDFAPKGYVTSRIYIKEYAANSTSSLFIANAITTFVPGVVACDNDLDGYDKWKNYSGYVHMSVEEAYDASLEEYYGKRYGATPYIKDYWPVNVPGTVTVSSSINAGAVLGYSESDGFKVEGSASYGYSKSFTVSDPVVNAQFDNTLSKAMWSYQYKENTAQSYDQETNVLYEISTSGNGLLYGDIRLKLDYKFVVDRNGFYTKKTYNDSIDLIVRPSLKEIYGFCYGMI